jgi:hypothetical protein
LEKSTGNGLLAVPLSPLAALGTLGPVVAFGAGIVLPGVSVGNLEKSGDNGFLAVPLSPLAALGTLGPVVAPGAGKALDASVGFDTLGLPT